MGAENFPAQFSKRILRRDNSIVLPTGLRMKLPGSSKFTTEVFVSECSVDWGSEEVFANYMDPSGVFLDVGANIGYYSLYMLPRVSPVHAFEPDPRAFATLRQNLSNHSNTYIHDLAVGNRNGRASFILESNSEVSHLAGSQVENGGTLHETDMTPSTSL